ncbi:MAG: dTMP kinase [Opitutales bacterium]|nr:dTMP kinase [Opitutales bacterium]
MSNCGIFITFEGGEGCGKTSQICLLAEFLRKRGRECVLVREPGGTAISEKIRTLLLNDKEGKKMSAKTEMLLFAAARAQLVDEKIRPALQEGKIVISDRFVDSTFAYQGAARSLGFEQTKSANEIAIGECMPNLTILLDLDARLGLARAGKRDEGETDRMGSQKIEFYEKVRAEYLRLARENPERFAVIDASKSIPEIAEKISKTVEEKFNV